ncbi:MAG TPA: CsgE family curli-type amyloid fiber assembly protein [Ignavibacteriaceae bacterium]
MRYNSIIGLIILICCSITKAQISRDTTVAKYREFLKILDTQIENRDSTLKYYSGIIDSLQLLKISSMPEFQKTVYEYLPSKLERWEMEQPTIEYVVKPGDNLWDIAKKKGVYNNPKEWQKIFQENKGSIENPDLIVPNQTLRLRNPRFLREILNDSLLYKEGELKSFTENISQNTVKDIEVEGLIVDQTQTKIGHDFYDLFFANWQPPENQGDYTIVISEKPFPQSGTQIIIKINDNEIFQQILQPRSDAIEAVAQYGVEICGSYIQNYEAIQKQLAGDDMKGSGIF